jgi:hypothetical protein
MTTPHSDTIFLIYRVKDDAVKFTFDRNGDCLAFSINGEDLGEDGIALDKALNAIAELGHDLQEDISNAFEHKDKTLERLECSK